MTTDACSPQSEETTITRAIDLAMLAVKVMSKECKGKNVDNFYTPFGNSVVIEEEIALTEYEEKLKEYLLKNKTDIETHMEMLQRALSEYYL